MVNHRPKKFTEIKSPHVFQGRAKEIPNWGIVREGHVMLVIQYP